MNVDGSEILYVMGGYAHYLAQKYGRPWLGDPATFQDAANSNALVPQFTLTLQPEIRWSAGCLANTDTRSQYRFDYVVDTELPTFCRAAPGTQSTPWSTSSRTWTPGHSPTPPTCKAWRTSPYPRG